jgi:hypothetical protein
MSHATTTAATFPPGPYHVRPASETSGWGVCVSADHEIVARIPGRNRAKVQAIARLLAAAPELMAEVEEQARLVSQAAAMVQCVAGVIPESGCPHCQLAADAARMTALLVRIHGMDSDRPPLFDD